MIFLECVGSRASLSAKQNEKRVRQGSFFCAQWWTKRVLGHNRGQQKEVLLCNFFILGCSGCHGRN